MWTIIVSNADTISRPLQSGIVEAVALLPLMIVAAAALGLAVVVTVWAETQTRQLDMLRVLAESERLIRAARCPGLLRS